MFKSLNLFDRLLDRKLSTSDEQPLLPVNKLLQFARECNEQLDIDNETIVIGHGVETLPALSLIKKEQGVRTICDVVEIPFYDQRSVKRNWNSEVVQLMNNANKGFLSECDGLMTVGPSLGRFLEPYNLNIVVIENYPEYFGVERNNALRIKCGLDSDQVLILAMNLITSNFEVVLETLQMLPDNFHVVTLGSFLPAGYKREMVKKVDALGLGQRVHLLPRVPYGDLYDMASGADIGWVVLSEEIGNHKVSLPNRIFDFVATGLPVVSPPITDIAKIVREYETGKLVQHNNADSYQKAILELRANEKYYKDNVVTSRNYLCWDRVKSKLEDALEGVDKILFLGVENIELNPRTQRFASHLKKLGKRVKFFHRTLF